MTFGSSRLLHVPCSTTRNLNSCDPEAEYKMHCAPPAFREISEQQGAPGVLAAWPIDECMCSGPLPISIPFTGELATG